MIEQAEAYTGNETPQAPPLPDVVGAIRASKESKRKIYPCHTNRASAIGKECVRELVYHRTAWDKRTLPDVGLQFIFDGGNLIEPYAIKMLEEAGFGVIEQQRHFQINENGENITGHLDLKAVHKDFAYPCEVKGLAGWTFDALNTIQDFFDNDRPYVRGYPAQLLAYLYGTGHEDGFFLLISKQSWQPKVIWIKLSEHLEYVESLLQKAVEVNRHVKAGTLPDFAENPDLCKRCDFSHICNPPIEYAGKIVVDPDLEDILDRRAELAEAKKEYDKIDRQIKTQIKGKELIVGNWAISGKWVKRDGYTVEPSEYWKSSIKHI